jgi:hypothetical protein
MVWRNLEEVEIAVGVGPELSVCRPCKLSRCVGMSQCSLVLLGWPQIQVTTDGRGSDATPSQWLSRSISL